SSTTPFQPVCASTISQTLRVLPLPSAAPVADVVEDLSSLEPQAAAPSSVAAMAAAATILRFTLPPEGEFYIKGGFISRVVFRPWPPCGHGRLERCVGRPRANVRGFAARPRRRADPARPAADAAR